MATIDVQYMPLTASETSTDDAVSVRAVRDMANNLNGFKAHFGTALIAQCYPVESSAQSAVATGTNSASEYVLLYYASRYVGAGYNTIRVSACGKCNSVPGGGSVAFKLYAMTSLPSLVIDTVSSGQLDHATSATLTFDDDTAYEWKHSTLSIPKAIDGRPDYIYLLLTGQNSSAAASFNAWLTNLTATVAYV